MKTQNFIKEVRSEVIERLNDRMGQTYELSDLGFALTESENANGSWYCCAHTAKSALSIYFDEAGQFYSWYYSSFGETPKNPYADPEAYHCSMMIFAIKNAFDAALNNTDYDRDSEIKIDEAFIAAITEALEEVFEVF